MRAQNPHLVRCNIVITSPFSALSVWHGLKNRPQTTRRHALRARQLDGLGWPGPLGWLGRLDWLGRLMVIAGSAAKLCRLAGTAWMVGRWLPDRSDHLAGRAGQLAGLATGGGDFG